MLEKLEMGDGKDQWMLKMAKARGSRKDTESSPES